MKPGDYLLMEFGHNDQKQKGPGQRGLLFVRHLAEDFHRRGAACVAAYRCWSLLPAGVLSTVAGRWQNTHADYPEAIVWLAGREQVPVVDLQEQTRILFETLGEEGSKKAFVHYPAGTFPNQTKPFADNTHFNPYGAYEIARCVIEEFKRLQMPFTAYLREDHTPFCPGISR